MTTYYNAAHLAATKSARPEAASSVTRHARTYQQHRCRHIFIAFSAILFLLGLGFGAAAQPAFADSDVEFAIEDHFVYCGGTYDFKVRPASDAKWKPQSYLWKVSLGEDGSGGWSSRHNCYESEEPSEWWYDTRTDHFKMNMKKFVNGSDDDDWGLLKFYCIITDTQGKTHTSRKVNMHVGSRDAFVKRWNEDPGTVSMENVVPAAKAGDVTKLTMEVGQSQVFSFDTKLQTPYWLAESDPFLKKQIFALSADKTFYEAIDGTSYTFTPPKAGDYVVSCYTTMLLGSGYDPYHPDAKPTATSRWYHVVVNEPGTGTPETSGSETPGAETPQPAPVSSDLIAAIQLSGSEGQASYRASEAAEQPIPAAGTAIPDSTIHPNTASKENGDFTIQWQKYVTGDWQSCKDLGEKTFQAGGTYRCLAAVTAKSGKSFVPDARNANPTYLRVSMLNDGGKRFPSQVFSPITRESLSQRVVYRICGFTVPADVSETPVTEDLQEALKEGLTFDAVIIGLEDKTYTGKAIKPAQVVVAGDQPLEEGTDYTISYASNKNVGTATVTITGIGVHSGKAVETFRILPKGTKISKTTASKKTLTVTWKRQAAKMSQKRITGYQLQYSRNADMSEAKIVTVKGYKKASKKLTGLDAKTTYYVQVRTYRDISGEVYYSNWSPVKSRKTK